VVKVLSKKELLLKSIYKARYALVQGRYWVNETHPVFKENRDLVKSDINSAIAVVDNILKRVNKIKW